MDLELFNGITYFPALASPLAVVGTPTSYGEGVTTSSGTVSSSFTMTPSGGSAPYTYEWTIVNSGDGRITVSSPTSATTTLTYSLLAANGSTVDAVLTGTVTDALMATKFVNISVIVARDSGGTEVP